MKHRAVIFCLALLMIACKKDADFNNSKDDSSIKNPYGSWKFIARQDLRTNTLYYRDQQVNDFCVAGRQCDIVLHLTGTGNAGSITGNTITNEVSGSFTFDGTLRTMQVLAFGGTKVGEPRWSYHIWDNMYVIETFEVNSSSLKLYFDNAQQRLIFERQ